MKQSGVDRPEDAIEDSLERFKEVVSIRPLTSLLLTGSSPVDLSISVSFDRNTVGKVELCCLDIVEELKEEKGNLFTMFPIGTTM